MKRSRLIALLSAVSAIAAPQIKGVVGAEPVYDTLKPDPRPFKVITSVDRLETKKQPRWRVLELRHRNLDGEGGGKVLRVSCMYDPKSVFAKDFFKLKVGNWYTYKAVKGGTPRIVWTRAPR